MNKNLARYLWSIKDMYPGGIPSELLNELNANKSCSSFWGSDSSKFLFVVNSSNISSDSFSGVSGSLLKASIEKGLNRNCDDFSVYICAGNSLDEDEVEFLKSHITKMKVKVTLFFGSEKLDIFLGEASNLARGQVLKNQSLSLMFTHSLDDISQNKEDKKNYWKDLQELSKLLV